MDSTLQNPWTTPLQVPDPPSTQCQCNVPGCRTPIEVILESNDGQRFGAHRDTTYDHRPSEWGQWSGELKDVLVMEDISGAVLDLLLRFMHNAAAPDLENAETIDIDTLLSLYGATERLGHFSVLEECRRALRRRAYKMSPDELLKVVAFKVRRSADSGADSNEIMRRTVFIPTTNILPAFEGSPEAFVTWSRYQVAWVEWEKKYDQAMNHLAYEPVHTENKKKRRCPQLKTYLELLRNLNVKKRRGGLAGNHSGHYYYPSWENYADLLSVIRTPPGFVSQCGCGASKLWKDKIRSVFEEQPRWEVFAA